jgi:hypothetical protein
MSRRRDARWAARALLALYPEAWRDRYGEEMLALLEDDPPRLRGLGSLLCGAVAAHLRPRASWRGTPAARMRLSIGFLFGCWMLLSLGGLTFQKVTENIPFDTPFGDASQQHQWIALGRAAILAGASLGALSIAIGGLPLLWLALRRALRAGEWRLRLLLALPALSLVAATAVGRALLLVAPARAYDFPASWVLAVIAPLSVVTIAWATGCALAARAVLRRIELPEPSLRRASLAGVALAAAMCAVTVGLAVYALALWQQAPGFSALATGPYGASTGATLAVDCAVSAALTAASILAAARAGRAALARG